MIKKLRRKLVAACMISLAVVLAVILGGVNSMSYQKVIRDADEVLTLLANNNGAFPRSRNGGQDGQNGGTAAGTPGARDTPGRRALSPETPYESRFFSVLLDADGQVLQTDTRQIAAVDEEAAAEYARSAAASNRSAGFLGDYRYLVQPEDANTRVVCLDCGRSLSAFRSTLLSSIALSLTGLLAVLVLLLILSRRIIRPVAESYEKQKRFITDAGHELKTPMTVIGADVDLAEMELGENQWLSDIRSQVQRLTGLTNDLIYLSRMEEERPQLTLIQFPLSDLAEETAQSFQALAKSQGKELALSIQPMLSCTGDEKAIRQLLSILLDNAIKYAPAGAQLALRLERQGRNVQLTVSNPTAEPVERGKLPRLFDRFYRSDQSRNSQTGGYGLGLSIAQGIVLAHKGKIRAESEDGRSLSVTVTLPL